MKVSARIVAMVMAVVLLLSFASCAGNQPAETSSTQAEKNGEVVVLFTSDVHCGVDKGFGYVGLKQIRDALEQQGYTTLLVDDGAAGVLAFAALIAAIFIPSYGSELYGLLLMQAIFLLLGTLLTGAVLRLLRRKKKAGSPSAQSAPLDKAADEKAVSGEEERF